MAAAQAQRKSDTSSTDQRKRVNVQETIAVVCGVLLIDVLILVTWTVTDELEWERKVISSDQFGAPLESEGHWSQFGSPEQLCSHTFSGTNRSKAAFSKSDVGRPNEATKTNLSFVSIDEGTDGENEGDDIVAPLPKTMDALKDTRQSWGCVNFSECSDGDSGAEDDTTCNTSAASWTLDDALHKQAQQLQQLPQPPGDKDSTPSLSASRLPKQRPSHMS